LVKPFRIYCKLKYLTFDFDLWPRGQGHNILFFNQLFMFILWFHSILKSYTLRAERLLQPLGTSQNRFGQVFDYRYRLLLNYQTCSFPQADARASQQKAVLGGVQDWECGLIHQLIDDIPRCVVPRGRSRTGMCVHVRSLCYNTTRTLVLLPQTVDVSCDFWCLLYCFVHNTLYSYIPLLGLQIFSLG